MPAIARKLQKIFGSNSANSGQVGSARATTFVLSTDLDVLQQLAAWQDGLNAVTVSGDKLMPLEEQQAIEFVITSQLKYLFQRGIPEYLATETYFENSLVIEPGTVKLYVSLTDDNIGNALSDAGEWALCVDLAAIEILPLNNYSATVDPTVNDDSGDGYSAGSVWYNSTGTGEAFLCVNASVGAAVWIKTTLTVDELGSAAFTASTAYATAAQGAKADTALQPADFPTYKSTGQTVTAGGSLVLPHGLGATPNDFIAYIQCTTAEAGFSIGDRMRPDAFLYTQNSVANYNWQLSVDATNVTVQFGAGGLLGKNESTGAVVALTAANWQLYVIARDW